MNVHNTGLSTGTSGAGQLSLENYELELKVKAIKKIPIIPPASSAFEDLFAMELGKVIS